MTKDWIGNSVSVFSQLGANRGNVLREINDFYATDPSAIDDLLRYEQFNSIIWEFACGQGHLAKRLSEFGYVVRTSDIVDRGYPNTELLDFLKSNETFNGDIITNPPYRYITEFVLKALDSVPNGCKVAMFLKIQTLEGQKRYEDLYKNYPPKTIYVFTKRKPCYKNGEVDKTYSSPVCYAWYVWIKGHYNNTQLKWIT